MANEFIARNGLISNAESTINGNLNAIGNIKITKISNPTLTIQSESLLSNIESPRILFKGNENINFWIDATNEGLRISNGENPGSSYTLFKNDGQIVTSNKITTVSGGISVSGVDKNSIIFSNVTGGTVLTGINTGDQDLSNLATYDYVNNHTILSTGGTISGSLFIDSAINSTGTTSGAIRTNGGLGVVGNGYFGGTVVSPMFIGELSGNTSTSDKLKNSRTIWGQSFDGTENVSGNMFGVGSISASGKLTISNGGISVAGVSKTENIFTDVTGGTVLKGVNTGDQDLSGLATYDYVNQTFPTTGHNHDDKYLQLTGGIINGDLMITGNTQVSNIKITSLNNGYLPYHVSDLSGLGNSPIYTTNSSVGIGTNTLMSTFHVKNYSSGNTENWIITLQNDNNNDLLKPTSGLLFVAGNTTSSKSGIIFQRTGSYGTGNLYFLNDSGENTNKPTISGSTKAVIMSNGNFLIGTSNDIGYKLNVNGSGYFSNGIIVKNVNQYENIFTDLTGGTVLKGVNTGDQDLSGLATYDYVDDTFLPFSGGIISGLLFVNNTTNSTNTTTGAIRTAGGLGVVGNGYFGGTVTAPTFSGALSGNASTATKLATIRTIWGQNFDGSGNVAGNIYGAGSLYTSGYLYSNKSGTDRTVIDYGDSGSAPIFGYGTANAGLNTYLDGNNIYLRTSSGHTNNMMLTSTGNVLIGTTTDSGYKLDIAGTLRISGNSIIGGMLNISGNTVINNTLLLNNKLTISSGGISVAGVSKTVNIFTDVTGGTVLKGVNTGDQDLSGLATYDYVNQTFSIIGHKHSSLYTPNGSLESVFIDNSGDLHVKNNLYVSGSTFNTNTETINVNANYIYLRDGATTGLINGEYTGLEAIKYDGINNGRLVFDNTGTARVGDVGFEQPLATRSESVNMLPNGFIYWDSTSGTLKTSTLTTTNISNNYYTQSVSDSRFVNVTGDSMSGKLTISSGGISVAGVSKTENIFTDLTGGTVLRGVNTGDQDLSDLATYDYVDENLVNKTTSIIAGAGLSGGGTLSGNVTLTHADTSSAISLTTSNSVFNVIQNAAIAIDTYGHVTSTSHSNINLDDHFIKVTGDTMTGVLYVNNSTNSTNTTTGAIRTSGGLGVVGNGYFGGTVTAPTFIGNLTGNASSATKLSTSRTIWGQTDTDGTGNISGAMTGVSTISASGIITASAILTTNTDAASLILRNGSGPALYVQNSLTSSPLIATFRYGSATAGAGTEVLGVSSAGINVTGTMYSSGNITTPGIVYTNGKANTGDQDLSNLSTYTYVDNTFLKKSGGTLTGGIEIQNTLSALSYARGGGGYNPYYNNIILRGSSSAGSSGILFTSSKGKTTDINQPSDRAFIQYHPYGVTLSAEGSLPTIGTTGETGKLVIGVGNDADDMVYIQTPSTTGIKHIVGTSIYTMWDSGNFTNLNQLTTRNFSDLQNKPTTLGGYGITDAYTKTYTDATYLKLTGGIVNNLQVNNTLHLHQPSSTILSQIDFYDITDTTRLVWLGANATTLLVNGNTVYHSGNIPTWNQNTTGNAATATKVIATVAGTNSIELVRAVMANNDYFRILVGGTATNAGYAEIATGDDGTEPIYVRQYLGAFTSLVRTATLLDANGNTSFPGAVTGSRFYTGYDSGAGNSISCSNWFRSNGATGWINDTYGGGIHMADTTYVRVCNNKAFKVSSTASDSINTDGGVLAGGTISASGIITGRAFRTTNTPEYSSIISYSSAPALYVQNSSSVSPQIASFRYGSATAGSGTEVMKVDNTGISVTGIVYTNGKANTGDQDLSNLSTYTYVDNTFLKLAGGTLTGGIEIQNTLSALSYARGGGGYNPYYNNIILRGSSSAGSSGILFTSSKGKTTDINQPSDRAFIQYHPYGVTLSAEGSLPTIGTTGETGKLVIGVGNDADDMVYIQTPSTTGIKHIVGTSIYTMWDSGNFTNLNQLTTRNFSDLQNKPTTLGGYGITDAYTKTYTDATYLKLTGGIVNNLQVNNTLHLHQPSSTILSQIDFYDITDTTRLVWLGANATTLLVNGNTVYHSGNIPTWNQNTTGNAATATKVIATVAGTNSIELVRAVMANNDYFRILVGGTATNAGYAEIATGDDGTEPIYVRQYLGAFTSLVRTATLLDANGNTSFPGAVTGSRFYTGYDSGAGNSISCSNWFRSNGATGWINDTYGGGIHMADTTYVRVCNNKAFKVSSTASDSINTDGGVLASGEIRSNSKFSYGTSAYSQYNSTTNSIDFIFN